MVVRVQLGRWSAVYWPGGRPGAPLLPIVPPPGAQHLHIVQPFNSTVPIENALFQFLLTLRGALTRLTFMYVCGFHKCLCCSYKCKSLVTFMTHLGTLAQQPKWMSYLLLTHHQSNNFHLDNFKVMEQSLEEFLLGKVMKHPYLLIDIWNPLWYWWFLVRPFFPVRNQLVDTI